MSWYLPEFDYEEHNAESRAVWEAYNAGKPIRVPVAHGINPRIILLNPDLNPERITFQQYFEDVDVMVRVQCASQDYVRHHMLQDAEMGLPADGWTVNIDFQNCYDAAWFGAEIEFREGQVPDTRPILTDDNKRMLFDRGFPDPFRDGIMARNLRFYEHISEHKSKYVHKGLPVIGVNPAGLGMDGIMTVAANLRGATELCLDIYEDPAYFHELLSYITEASIHRMKAWRAMLGHEMKPKNSGLADDSIELLSTEVYKEFVLPYHKRLMSETAGEGPHGIHLCGNVCRHMPTLKQELNLNSWDSGFPVDFGAMRRELGPDFSINGGPRVSLVQNGTPREVEDECRRIMSSGIMDGGKFVLAAANNVSPCTPAENIAAMYHAAHEFGTY